MLGRWHVALADVNAFERAMAQIASGKLPDSTCQEAGRCFEKAIELNPDPLMHYISWDGFTRTWDGPTKHEISSARCLAMRETEEDDPRTKRLGEESLAKLP